MKADLVQSELEADGFGAAGLGGAQTLLAKLMEQVRSEFRVEALRLDASFFPSQEKGCSVCGKPPRAHSLCGRHHQRWTVAGRPELTVWVAEEVDRPPHGAGGAAKCSVAACLRSRGGG